MRNQVTIDSADGTVLGTSAVLSPTRIHENPNSKVGSEISKPSNFTVKSYNRNDASEYAKLVNIRTWNQDGS